MESTRKELVTYLRAFDVVLFSMFIVFGIVGIVTLVFVGVPGIMFIIPAVLAFSYWHGKYSGAATFVKSLEKDGKLDSVLSDFRDGEKLLNGRLIRGRNYIMSRGSGTVLGTDEVVRLYDCRKKNGFAGDTRVLMAETRDGKQHELTFLSIKGKDDGDIGKLVS